jgi:putative nucleotidyltransferase with HDIG domain
MPLFGPKKTRTSRAATLRPASGVERWFGLTVRNRDLWLRLGLVLAGLLLLLPAVQAWRSPFPYRLGDRVPHGLLAKVDFVQPDRHRTDLARDEAEAAVIPIFRHDPSPLDKLLPRLRSHLSDIANATTVDDVPVATRAAFGLTTAEQPQQSDSPNMDMHTEFSTLKALVAREDGVEGNRIDQLIDEFRRFLEPVRKYGLADPETFTRHDLRTDSSIAVVRDGNEASREVVLPADVQLTELLGKTGLLGKSWQEFPELQQPALQKYLTRWLTAQDPTTLVYDVEATQQARRLARETTETAYDQYHRGDVLLPPEQAIDDDHLAVLHAEYDRMEELATPVERLVRMLTIFVLLVVLAVLNGRYLVTGERRLVNSGTRLGLFLGSIVVAVTLGRVLSFDPWRAEVIPLTATVMVFAIAYNQVLATLMALSLCLVLTVSTRANLPQFVVLMSVSATCVMLLSQVPSRTTLIKVGFWAGVVYFLVSLGIGVVSRQTFTQAWADPYLLEASLRGAAWCLASGYLVAGSLPFVESAFGVVTDISLLEMSDVSHPLLQELVRRAPGTYNHSMTVASIGESAADAIGANGLLVRVGAYFHDVGKMLKPHYFIENVHKGDESRHNRLNPAMSTLIIIGHVKDGVDLAKQHNLPRQLVDFIEQHHGTTLVEYFYNAAKGKADEQPGHRTDAEESLFRYPGPKPQTKEAGVLMIADAVESASRTLSEPTPASIENLVNKIVMKKLLDGQFDESTLNLTEIHAVEASLIKSLIGIYHGRIKYPEQQRSVSA